MFNRIGSTMKYFWSFCYSLSFATTLLAQPVPANLLANWDDPDIPGSIFYDNAYNEVWGLSINDREIAIIGSTLGTHFIDVTDPQNPQELKQAFVSGAAAGGNIVHRDYHDHNGFLYAVCDEGQSTLQVIDIRNLPDTVTIVHESADMLSKSHNIFIDASTGKMYACGVRKAGSSSFIPLQVYCLDDPTQPELLTDVTQINGFNLPYAHDIFVRNDTAYLNCGGSGLYVIDFHDPLNPVLLGSMNDYPQSGYNHSGWLHPNGKYYYMADETHGKDLKVVDVSDLSNIEVITTFNAGSASPFSIPHNLIVRCGKLYVSWYYDGVQVFDLYDPANPILLTYYFTSDIEHQPSYEGAWGVFPFLESGNFLVSDMQKGLFVLETIDGSCNPAFSTSGTVSCADTVLSVNATPTAISSVNIFPTSTTGTLHVVFEATYPNENCLLEVFSLDGSKIQSEAIPILTPGNQTHTVQLKSNIPTGLYVVRVVGNHGSHSEKIMLQH